MSDLNDWLQNASPDVKALNDAPVSQQPIISSGNGRRHKYNAHPVEIDGYVFASGKEGRRYLQLKAMQQAGEIFGLELQPEFELLPAFRDITGKKHRAIKYRADFKYRDITKAVIVEDSKGYETAVFKIKRKLFCHRYDYELRLT